jgi:CHAT domain-containing protein
MDLRATKPFVCSIACDSGVQDVNEGDEPLGLVSAIFCAGASSVLGTLWPIHSQTGRTFTSHFYNSLAKQIKEPPIYELRFGRVLNLARAVREAIIAVKKDKKDPYSWASFVLHDAGFYRIEQSQMTLLRNKQ